MTWRSSCVSFSGASSDPLECGSPCAWWTAAPPGRHRCCSGRTNPNSASSPRSKMTAGQKHRVRSPGICGDLKSNLAVYREIKAHLLVNKHEIFSRLICRIRQFTIFPQERPSFQVYEPLENSLHALDSDSSLLLQLLRGYSGAGAVRLSWLRH